MLRFVRNNIKRKEKVEMKTNQKKILSLNLFFLCKNPPNYKIVGLKLEIQARNQNFFRAGEVS